MKKFRHFILSHTPEKVVDFARKLKKALRRKELKAQQIKGGISQDEIEISLRNAGIQSGDSMLVHASLSKIGYVINGPVTIINAMLAVLGKEGTLLMPSFPATGRNKDYLSTNIIFDVLETPSAMGIITEVFRKMKNVNRSLHPTDPVCALGPLSGYYTNTHFGQLTPYNDKSPFRKLAEKNGKILMLGTTLNGAGTSLHTLEDAVDFPFPVYDEKIFDVTIRNEKGELLKMKTKVHNPIFSAKRNCDALKPLFEKAGVLTNFKIGEANCMLIDAKGMFDVMIREFNLHGVTMYTPYGQKIK